MSLLPAAVTPLPSGAAAGLLAVALLALSLVPVLSLRTLEPDREAGRRTLAIVLGPTATRVLYSVLVVAAFVVLILAWGLGLLPTGALLPFLTAPLAMRLGDTVSHRSGGQLATAPREALLLLVAFAVLLAAGAALPF